MVRARTINVIPSFFRFSYILPSTSLLTALVHSAMRRQMMPSQVATHIPSRIANFGRWYNTRAKLIYRDK
jgi:hypothetical protein